MTNENEYQTLSNAELLKKKKAMQSSLIVNCVIIGLFVGVAVYSAVKNGIGFFTFFPLFFIFLISKNQASHKALDREINSRNLK